MFDPHTLQELAPVQQERRAFNLEQWHAEVAAAKQDRAEANVALGRLFRRIYQEQSRADARMQIEAAGFHPAAAAGFIRQANEEDGIAVPPLKPRGHIIDKAGLREMLAMLKAGEVDDVIATLEEMV